MGKKDKKKADAGLQLLSAALGGGQSSDQGQAQAKAKAEAKAKALAKQKQSQSAKAKKKSDSQSPCTACGGNPQPYSECPQCGARGICWGGGAYVFLFGGGVKQVRDCRAGDEVLTLMGPRRISRVWDSVSRQTADTEVCFIDGIWITSHHPVVSHGEWVFPADLVASHLWRDMRHSVPDLFNFELEGHCDTIILWSGGEDPVVVSCTIGKYLGTRFGCGYATRRSTRCPGSCAQCDAVYVEGIDFGRIPSSLRWKRFPLFPQVEWDASLQTDVEVAEHVKAEFKPQLIPTARCFPVTHLEKKLWESIPEETLVAA
eukprot:gnl/MRDRNA2_/MRDRNA2_116315_c0_seq1.p1 gnl/MRDRNA2_/MRDRNA2_116315_c0~~gnl/MRDRNA2_/MRDRNA2_116315_c0_seq1.p1  ORF type:complete len:316 (+),score=59.83 gnl/MRDRNA2_/MRDRNA2_116315_c0_seq1:126-1073(+)